MIRENRLSDRRGVAALEFALLAPLFMMMLIGGVDFADAYMAKSILDATLSSASNYALLNTAMAPATLASNLTAIIANSSGVVFDGSVVVNNGNTSTVTGGMTSNGGSANTNCYCPSGTPPTLTWGMPVACGTVCPGSGIAGNFVSMNATYSYVPILTGYAWVPSGTLSASAVVQTK